MLQPHNVCINMRKQYEKGLYSTEDQVILKYSSSKVDINEAVVWWPHNGYINMRKWYETGQYSVGDDHT